MGLNLNWNVAVAPLAGEDAEGIYDRLPWVLKRNIEYHLQNVIGSTPFLASGVDEVVQKYGARVSRLPDLSLKEVMDFVRGQYYTNSVSLIARSKRGMNKPLIKRLFEIGEEELGHLTRNEILLDGFNVTATPTGYIDIKKSPDSRVIQDQRLHGRYNRRKFNEVDELGLPLFTKHGSRRWYAGSSGLSGIYLNEKLWLLSGQWDIARSTPAGRVLILKERIDKSGRKENYAL